MRNKLLLRAKVPGKRIYLRSMQVRDISDEYISWLNDLIVNRFLSTYKKIQNYRTVKAYINSFRGKRDKMLLGIYLNESNLHIGNISLAYIDWKHSCAGLGICLGVKELWGQGLGVEALECMKKIAFGKLKINRLEACALVANKASVRLFKKAGFKVEGWMREKERKDGVYYDVLLLALLKKDWVK